MAIIYKDKKVVDGETSYLIRTLGHDFWITEKEFSREVENGNMFYKVNKPVYKVA